MRTIEFMEIIPQIQQTHKSCHTIIRSHQGNTQTYMDNSRGKIQNIDYERIHYENV